MSKEKVTIIDGSKGEGGGQIFRTSLTLAMCLGKAVCIENIRAGRAKPGLLRQHMVCLQAAKEISDADVEGAELKSQRVVFKPGKIKAGSYHFAVGSAGSTSLIFQTIIMPLLLARGRSELSFEGGTHNSMAPSFDFIARSFLPVLKAMGCQIEANLQRYGFYPAGGGLWHAIVYPSSQIQALSLLNRGELVSVQAKAISSKIPLHVGERELTQVKKKCAWADDNLQQIPVDSVGPGNVISLRVIRENITAVFDAFGEKNVSAERVANRAINALVKFDRAEVPVCEYLADQLIVPMVLGLGGVYRTTQPSEHLLTNIEVVKQLSNVDIAVKPVDTLSWEVRVDVHR